MKNLNIQRSATIEVSFSADQWELFDVKGRDQAAADLNKALQDAVNAPGATEQSVHAAMRPVQQRLGDLGADDGEAQGLIDHVVEKVFGDPE